MSLSFEIGDTVSIFANEGTIRFIGDTQFSPGTWVGIELKTPNGRNDGSIQGIKYFECKKGFGIFVRPSQIRLPSMKNKTKQRTKIKPSRLLKILRPHQEFIEFLLDERKILLNQIVRLKELTEKFPIDPKKNHKHTKRANLNPHNRINGQTDQRENEKKKENKNEKENDNLQDNDNKREQYLKELKFVKTKIKKEAENRRKIIGIRDSQYCLKMIERFTTNIEENKIKLKNETIKQKQIESEMINLQIDIKVCRATNNKDADEKRRALALRSQEIVKIEQQKKKLLDQFSSSYQFDYESLQQFQLKIKRFKQQLLKKQTKISQKRQKNRKKKILENFKFLF
ncbi:nip100 protein [Anaeramoeba flamelloides]|uniref:Nip100 protein n=1 Tax=Anaeramoeba flamelloides TaxID=1746091 RepID=A0ABQ8XU47_9EUKA|nr:nip100 protein [Anaeramoeba flamelloides]